jgi:hypothetical protein
MSMLIRVSYFFQFEAAGWTETFYSLAADLPTAMINAQLLLPKRVILNALKVRCFYIRVSDDEVSGDSIGFSVPIAQQTTPKVIGPELINAIYDGVEIRMPTDVLHRRVFIMRGIPDVLQEDGVFKPNLDWNTNFPLWAAMMTSGVWGMKVASRAPQHTLSITTMVNDFALGKITVTTEGPHLAVTGNLVSILGRINVPGLRGNYRIRKVDAVTYTIQSRRDVSTYNGFGRSRTNVYDKIAFTAPLVVGRLGKRDTGRPSLQPRGRRSAIPRV